MNCTVDSRELFKDIRSRINEHRRAEKFRTNLVIASILKFIKQKFDDHK